MLKLILVRMVHLVDMTYLQGLSNILIYLKNLINIKNPKLRRNISKIRLSAHNFPIEILRKKKVQRDDRLCHMCDGAQLGNAL